jgi:hypothetical protein
MPVPLPSPRGKEERGNFISRCISDLTKKGEGEDSSQRAAICNSQWSKSKAGLTEEENKAMHELVEDSDAQEIVKKKKKKKKRKKGPEYT